MRRIYTLFFVVLLVFVANSQTNTKTSEVNYRYKMEKDQLKVEKTYFNLGKINNTEVKIVKSGIYNDSDQPIKIEFLNTPKFITVKVNPLVLNPKQIGEIVVEYDAAKNVDHQGKQRWGYQNSRINLVANGNKVDSKNYFTVRSDIQEDFSNLTEEQLKKAPKAVFKEKAYNFGKVKQGETVVHEFVFTNQGETDLEIRRVKGS